MRLKVGYIERIAHHTAVFLLATTATAVRSTTMRSAVHVLTTSFTGGIRACEPHQNASRRPADGDERARTRRKPTAWWVVTAFAAWGRWSSQWVAVFAVGGGLPSGWGVFAVGLWLQMAFVTCILFFSFIVDEG